jgi:hypothetical protein
MSSPITVQFKLDIDRIYDYSSGDYVWDAAPIRGTGSVTFDAATRSINDNGPTTSVNFGGALQTTWSSPITPLIPQDPYSGTYGPYNSYTWGSVSDSPFAFVESASPQVFMSKNDGTNSAYYLITLQASKQSLPRGGDGTSDYAFTRDSLLAFLQEFKTTGAPVYFEESFAQYSITDGIPIYSAGMMWQDWDARVINVIDHTAPVPEPTTYMLMVAGLGLLTFVAKRRRYQSS